MYSSPVLHVHYDYEGQQYLLQEYMEDPQYGYSVGTGDFIYVDIETMRNNGLGMILGSLEKYFDRTEKLPDRFQEMTTKEHRAFHKAHPSVAIDMLSPNKLYMEPYYLTSYKTMCKGDSSKGVEINLPCEPGKFIKVLNSLLNIEVK